MTDAPNSAIPRSLFFAMVLQFATGGAFIPFVTMILRDRGLDFGQIGLVFFVSSSTLLICPFLWGMLADRFIPIDRLFTLLNLLAAAALGFFTLQTSFLGLLLCFTFFYACFNPSLTLMNALSFHHLNDPRTQFGVLRSWGSIGWILPCLPIYLWMIQSGNQNLDFVVFVSLALALAMAAVTFLLPHTPPGARSSPANQAARLAYWPAVKRLLRDPNYVTILLSFFLMAASFSILIFYSPPLLEDIGVPRPWIGPIQTIGVFLEVLLFRWQPGVIKNLSYPASILIGCLALVLRHLLFAFCEVPWLLCLSYLLAGAVIVFYMIGISILVNTLASSEVRATAQTLLVFFGSGMGPMCANWTASRLAAHYGDNLHPIFLFAAVLATLASLLIFLRRAHLANAKPNIQ